MDKDQVYGGIFGVCVGDALGVPAEGRSRASLAAEPITGLTGGGAHDQPPGTWSDDSSLALCLTESLCDGYSLADIGERFVRYLREGYWTPHGKAFGVGATTRRAIQALAKGGTHPENAGPRGENDNGNGALMRILPLAFTLRGLPFEERFKRTAQVTSLTHGHMRSIVASVIFVEVAMNLVEGRSPAEAFTRMRKSVSKNLAAEGEVKTFDRILLDGDLAKLPERDIRSSGYVLDTLEAALWCLLTEDNYSATVLKAVNLGGDSDTVAAVAGGLAGIADGYKGIPKKWREKIARHAEIAALAERFFATLRA